MSAQSKRNRQEEESFQQKGSQILSHALGLIEPRYTAVYNDSGAVTWTLDKGHMVIISADATVVIVKPSVIMYSAVTFFPENGIEFEQLKLLICRLTDTFIFHASFYHLISTHEELSKLAKDKDSGVVSIRSVTSVGAYENHLNFVSEVIVKKSGICPVPFSTEPFLKTWSLIDGCLFPPNSTQETIPCYSVG